MRLLFLDKSGRIGHDGLFALGGAAVRAHDWRALRESWLAPLTAYGWGASPLARGTAPGEVWNAVREKAARMQSHSPTSAQADLFRSRARELGELEGAFALVPGQRGAVLALDDTLCLDFVDSRLALEEELVQLSAFTTV